MESNNKPQAPNYRIGGECCVNCDHSVLINASPNQYIFNPMVKCKKYGLKFPGGVCDDYEDD